MSVKRTVFHSHLSGQHQQHRDEYTLIELPDGTRTVEHAWTHVSFRRGGKLEQGSAMFSIADFLSSGAPQDVKNRLSDHLMGKDDA